MCVCEGSPASQVHVSVAQAVLVKTGHHALTYVGVCKHFPLPRHPALRAVVPVQPYRWQHCLLLLLPLYAGRSSCILVVRSSIHIAWMVRRLHGYVRRVRGGVWCM